MVCAPWVCLHKKEQVSVTTQMTLVQPHGSCPCVEESFPKMLLGNPYALQEMFQ
jgi:hypothetical protein